LITEIGKKNGENKNKINEILLYGNKYWMKYLTEYWNASIIINFIDMSMKFVV